MPETLKKRAIPLHSTRTGGMAPAACPGSCWSLPPTYLERRRRAQMQIGKRDYAAELRALGASSIHGVAVIFDGKQVLVGAAPAGR